jgi:hypothetical protein
MPRMSGKFRYEDFIYAFIAIILVLLYSKRKSIINIELHFYMYFIYVIVFTFLFSVSIWDYRPMFIPIRELFYFFGFLGIVYSAYLNCHHAESLKRLVVFLAFVSSLWIVYSILLGVKSYYGIGHFSEPGNSSASSIIFFNLFVIMFYLSVSSHNKIYFVLAAILFFGVLSVGARTGQIMLFLFMLIYAIGNIRSNLRKLVVIILLPFSIVIFYFLFSNFLYNFLYNMNFDNPGINAAIRRFGTLFNISDTFFGSRFNSWNGMWKMVTVETIVGCGKGCSHTFVDGQFTTGLGKDFGYLKTLIEAGVIGFILFYSILYHLYKIFKRHSSALTHKIFIAYTFSYMIGEVSFELFQLSKGGGLFWIISALMIVFDVLSKKNVFRGVNRCCKVRPNFRTAT